MARILFVAFVNAIVLTLSYHSSALARDPAPIIEGTTTPASTPAKKTLEERLSLIERRLDNQALVEVMTRLDRLQRDVQQLVGDIEVQTHNIEGMKKRQRDLYLDIDRRIQQTEEHVKALKAEQKALSEKMAKLNTGTPMPVPQGSPSSTPSPVSTGPAPAPVKPAASSSSLTELQLEREAYNRAFNLLKDGRFDLAIASFKAFIETYPNAKDADDAQYWLGDANYAQGRYDVALAELQKVLDRYPNSSKKPDALLRMGFTYEMMGDKTKAMEYLGKVSKEFPSSTAAHLAAKRLQSLKRK